MAEASRVWTLLPYQAAWVRDASPVKVCVKSRRIGISYAEAFDAVRHAGSGAGDVVYISFSKDMTAGWIGDCAGWARALEGLVASEVEEGVLLDDDREIATYTMIDRLCEGYPVARIHVDQTGMGEAVVEALQGRHGVYRVTGRLMTGEMRLQLATGLREAFEERRLRIPRDRSLRDDVRSVRRAPSAAGAPRLVSEGKDTDGHADRFWALALAVDAAQSGAVVYEAHRVPRAMPGLARAVQGRGSALRRLPGGLL